LQGYDYAQPGAYFITIVAHDRQCLFGEIVNGEMRINECGKMAQQCWLDIPNHFPQTQLDEYIIMPDHIHGIIIINDSPIVGAKNFSPLPSQTSPRQSQSLSDSPQQMPESSQPSSNPSEPNITRFRSPSQTIGSIVRGFKIGVTKWIHQIEMVKNISPQPNVWQRNYYEHIIRNDDELHRIRQYIRNNPQNWRGS
jgi:REP element-mobilizing transposase RayT